MNRSNALDVASHIVSERKLKYNLVTEGKGNMSIRFYYLFEKVRYAFWVNLEMTSLSWEYEKSIVATDKFINAVTVHIQEMEETQRQIDSCIKTIMEVKHGKDSQNQ